MSRLRDLSSQIASRDARVGVIGLGYVGLPLAVQFAKVGFRVTGFDLDADKVEKIIKKKTMRKRTRILMIFGFGSHKKSCFSSKNATRTHAKYC